MIRTLNTAERNLQSDPPNVITLPAATPVVLLIDSRFISGEIAYRRVQNVGEDNLYLSFGITTEAGGPQCNAVNMFHKLLLPGQEIDCSNDRQIVCGYSVAGTIAATETRQRLSL